MNPRWLLLRLVLPAIASGSALAQQPVRPLPKVGGCPPGYYTSGDYCMPSSSGSARGAIEKVGGSCPPGVLFLRQLLREQPQQQP